jgi:hypothetical protein
MKKILIITVILFAALENYGQFTFGPKIGYNTSKLSTDFDSISESIKHNFQIGAFARFGKKLYVQPEIFYATSGGTLKLEGTTVKKEEVKFNNLCIPVLVGFKIINAKVISLRVMAGPVANFILGTKVEASDVITDPLQDSDFKKAAWGMDLGAGVDVFFLTLDVRYEFGLNNIYIVPDGGVEQSMKSNLFIVSLGFKLL